jgi:large subunit ribosomal protein L30
MSNEKTVRVTLVKSTIGYGKKQQATIKALGLRKMNASRVVKVTPQVRGMLDKVSHLVSVEEVEE